MARSARAAVCLQPDTCALAPLLLLTLLVSACSTVTPPMSAKVDALRQSLVASPIPVFEAGDAALARQLEPLLNLRPGQRLPRYPRFFAVDQPMNGFSYDDIRQEMWSWALGPTYVSADGKLHIPLDRRNGALRVLVASRLSVERRYGAAGRDCQPTTVAMPRLGGLDADQARQLARRGSLRVRYFVDLDAPGSRPWDSFRVEGRRCDLDLFMFFGERNLLYMDSARVVAAVWYDPNDPSAFWSDVSGEPTGMFRCDAGTCELRREP